VRYSLPVSIRFGGNIKTQKACSSISEKHASLKKVECFLSASFTAMPNLAASLHRFPLPSYEDAKESATLPKVTLARVPMDVIAVKQTTTIKASMTAYSTAVGPSSELRKLRTFSRYLGIELPPQSVKKSEPNKSTSTINSMSRTSVSNFSTHEPPTDVA
jgi:hypothetical protein